MKATISIEGMTCGHCVSHATQALSDMDGVSSVTINLEQKSAIVEIADDLSDELLKQAIDDAGYTATSIDRT